MKLGNFKKIPEILEFVGKYPVVHPNTKLWCFPVKNCKKSVVKHENQ